MHLALLNAKLDMHRHRHTVALVPIVRLRAVLVISNVLQRTASFTATIPISSRAAVLMAQVTPATTVISVLLIRLVGLGVVLM